MAWSGGGADTTVFAFDACAPIKHFSFLNLETARVFIFQNSCGLIARVGPALPLPPSPSCRREGPSVLFRAPKICSRPFPISVRSSGSFLEKVKRETVGEESPYRSPLKCRCNEGGIQVAFLQILPLSPPAFPHHPFRNSARTSPRAPIHQHFVSRSSASLSLQHMALFLDLGTCLLSGAPTKT